MFVDMKIKQLKILNIKDIWLPDIEIFNLVSKKSLRREGEEKVKIIFSPKDVDREEKVKIILSPKDVDSRWF